MNAEERDAAEYFRRRMNVEPLLAAGLDGKGARVAIVDTGMNAESLPGDPPVWEVDFTGEGTTRDRSRVHGTWVATCVRRIAPECDLINAKVVPGRAATTTKAIVAQAIRQLADDGVEVINVSLDFDAGECSPQFEERFFHDFHPQVIEPYWVLNRRSACELCVACWDVAVAGVAVVVAAGNRWGALPECPGRSPGALTVESTALRAEWEEAWGGRSRLGRLWDWKIRGHVGRYWGTSFSSGYASGLVALLMAHVRQLGWMEARERMLSADRKVLARKTVDGSELLRRLTALPPDERTFWMKEVTPAAEAASTRQLLNALATARHEPSMAGHAMALDCLRPIDPESVAAERRQEVHEYLDGLAAAVSEMDAEAREFFERLGLTKLRHSWAQLES